MLAAAPIPPRSAPPSPRRRRVLIAALVAWGLVLLGAGTWYSLHGSPTVRDQTTIAQAQPYADRAAGNVLAAVAGTGSVPAISGYQKAADCALTPVRQGARYERVVRLYVRPGGEADLLGRLAAGLPRGYRATVRGRSLVADAGFYVLVTGDVEQPGVVTIVAGTGCRPLGHPPASDPGTVPPAATRAAVDPVLAALRAGTVRWSTHELPCGARTVEAITAADTGLAPLRTVLHPGAAPVVDGDDVYAYVSAGTAVAAYRSAGQLTVTATTGSCVP